MQGKHNSKHTLAEINGAIELLCFSGEEAQQFWSPNVSKPSKLNPNVIPPSLLPAPPTDISRRFPPSTHPKRRRA